MKYFFPLIFLSFFSTSTFSQTEDSIFSIKNIIVEGNKKTKERIILRELSFEIGDSFNSSEIDSLFTWNKNRIYNTNLFNTVDLELTNIEGSFADVKIIVDERWYFYPGLIFRMIDRNLADWWVNRDRDLSRINYGVRFRQNNFGGRGEIGRLTLQTGFTQGIGMRYSFRNLGKKQNHSVTINSSFTSANIVAYNTIMNIPSYTFDSNESIRKTYANRVTHTYRPSYYTFHTTTLSHNVIQIADTLSQLNPNYLEGGKNSQSSISIGYSFRYDKRNNVNYATKGTRFSATLFKLGLGIDKDGVDYWSGRIRAAKYWNLKNNWFAASDVSTLASFPARRAYNNYSRLGGFPETLRGYDLSVIEGHSYVIQRNELKLRFFNQQFSIKKVMPIKQLQNFPIRLYWKVFYDHGYVRGFPDYTGSEPLSDSYLNSFGTGLDFHLINDATIRIEAGKSTQGRFIFLNFLSLI